MAAFATYADMIDQYDESTLADLCSDDGVPTFELSESPKMIKALARATGAIKAACHVGGIYSTEDLQGLEDESQAYLVSLTCELALAFLLLRRPEKYGDYVKEIRRGVEDELDRFRKGERVFEVDANIAAGLPTVDGPRIVDYQRLNLIPERTKNFYPNRSGRLPLGRG